MSRVILLDYTGSPKPWAAADLMIFTKNTRVKMSPNGLVEISQWSNDKKIEELTYMANTIRSSWEFCDYTFLLEGVTRAFTHQLVRHRHGTYAQQTMQILKVDAGDVEFPAGMPENAEPHFSLAVGYVAQSYEAMLAQGATVEQARGILPTNIKTNIVCKFNLRTLVELFGQRISPRNLGEFRSIAAKMKEAVIDVHPWARVFLNQTRELYLAQLDEELMTLRDSNPANLEGATRALKMVDQLRRNRPMSDDDE